MLQQVAAHLALPGAGGSREERAAVEEHGDSPAALVNGPHLGDHVLHEQELPVRYAGQPSSEATSETELLVFLAYSSLRLLPIDTVGRVRDLVAEGLTGHLVVRQRVAQVYVGDVAALENRIALADGVGLTVDFLRVGDDGRLRVDFGHAVGEDRESAAGTGAGVAHLHDAVRLREVIHLADDQQLRRQA